jgi:amidase
MSRTAISHEDSHIFEFEPEMKPVGSIQSGEELTIETVDSLSGEIQTDNDLLESIPDKINAATGPIEVKKATPGDVLKINIEDIRVNEDRGRVITAPDFGLLQDNEDIEHPSTRITPVEGDKIRFDELQIDIKPVVGIMGVAPVENSYSTLIPHDHGGNLDTTDITKGATVYLPVFQHGAMLAMGDSKAALADGEMCGTGSEIGTSVDITVELIENPHMTLQRPLIETNKYWKTIASAKTIKKAAKLANQDAIELLIQEHEFEPTEAYHFSSLVGGLEISQVVDPLMTVRNAVPNEFLSNPF